MPYTKQWWEKNREAQLAKRKLRYQTDPGYREAAKENAKRNREKKRMERAAIPVTIPLLGKTHRAVSVAELTEQHGITADKVKYYQRQGYIPPAPITKPRRYYTMTQVMLIRELADFLDDHKNDLRKPDTDTGGSAMTKLTALIDAIHRNWNK